MRTAFVIAAITPAACSGSRIRLQPALCLAIFGTGHPMSTSTMSAPIPSTISAAAAIFSGSPPKIWIETGRSSSVYSAYSSVRSMPRTSPSALTISVTTRPQPPCRFTRRRNAESVMPAIGAMAYGDGSWTEPIRIDNRCLSYLAVAECRQRGRSAPFERERLLPARQGGRFLETALDLGIGRSQPHVHRGLDAQLLRKVPALPGAFRERVRVAGKGQGVRGSAVGVECLREQRHELRP